MAENTQLGSPTKNLAFITIIDDDSLPDLEPEQRIVRFHYMPDKISESKSAIWDPVTILGRSEPIRFYGSSGTRVIDLTLSFHVMTDADSDVEENIRFLRSLVYPDYSDAAKSAFSPLPPPVVLLHIGDWLSMRSIVTSVNVTRYGPWEHDSLLPNRADVALKIEELSIRPHDITDVILSDDTTESPFETNADGVLVRIPSSGSSQALVDKQAPQNPNAEESLAHDKANSTVTQV